MSGPEIDRLLFHWPAVCRASSKASNEWAKGFARSIAAKARSPRWRPTDKQAEIMRRMVNELFQQPDEGDDFMVIE